MLGPSDILGVKNHTFWCISCAKEEGLERYRLLGEFGGHQGVSWSGKQRMGDAKEVGGKIMTQSRGSMVNGMMVQLGCSMMA